MTTRRRFLGQLGASLALGATMGKLAGAATLPDEPFRAREPFVATEPFGPPASFHRDRLVYEVQQHTGTDWRTVAWTRECAFALDHLATGAYKLRMYVWVRTPTGWVASRPSKTFSLTLL